MEGDQVKSVSFGDEQLRLEPEHIVLTSGEGFEPLADKLNIKQPEMQRRPLHMVMVKHQHNLPMFAHCIGAGSKPVATVTTHPCHDGGQVWYLGGNVAETGMERSEEQQIAFAKKN